MARSAYHRIDRATEHIAELNEMFRKERPFRYVLETNVETGERSTRGKKNTAVVERAATLVGDIAHNLRSSLDHTYWDIVSPFATTPRERKAVQFPFSETADRLDMAVKNRLANRVSERFFDAIVALQPHAENSGNRLLYLIDRLNVSDKHRAPTPMGNYKRINSDILRRQIPDFPEIDLVEVGFGALNGSDIAWRSTRIEHNTLGNIVPPSLNRYEKELDVPVEIVFVITEPDFVGPVIPTLNKLVDVAKETIAIMKRAAVNAV